MTFIINDMPDQAPDELIRKLSKMETATAGHMTQQGFLDPSLRPVDSTKRAVGTAVTLAIPSLNSTLLHYVLGLVRPGDFIVIDRMGDRSHACVGGGIALAAKVAGVAGIVVDGPCTDEDQIKKCKLPVWCRGVTALTTVTHLPDVEGTINATISCGNVSIKPGDVVVADANGILVMSVEKAGTIVDEALDKQKQDPQAQKLILAGNKIGELSGATKKVEGALAMLNKQTPAS